MAKFSYEPGSYRFTAFIPPHLLFPRFHFSGHSYHHIDRLHPLPDLHASSTNPNSFPFTANPYIYSYFSPL